MTQKERLFYLIQYLINENTQYNGLEIPDSEKEQKRLLRSLMNVRPPKPILQEFLHIQDTYLAEENHKKPITSLTDLTPIRNGIYLWKGDITTLKVDAIVNAANDALLGCFVPCHGCIDNAIHSAAGVQLRLTCHKIMNEQGQAEPTGRAKITPAFNLPCRYVLHTVGPIIHGPLTQNDRELLASCYRSCLKLATIHQLKSIAFCCISTGEFHFPNEIAAQIAIETVQDYQKKNPFKMEVIFNVFKETDYEIYKRLLQLD